jgi:hypothetical protein
MSAAIRSGTGRREALEASRRASTSWPTRYSRTRKYDSSISPKSKTWTTFGWERRAATRASSRNIVTNSWETESCGSTRLTTTSRTTPPGPVCRARNTSAIPP